MEKKTLKTKRKRTNDLDNQTQAVGRLVWGSIVFAAGLAGCFGVVAGITALVILGAVLDAVDSVAVADIGGLISAAFFGLIGVLVCFIVYHTPWWYGFCAGMCFESALGGLIAYSIRFYNFVLEKREQISKTGVQNKARMETKKIAQDTGTLKRALKRKIKAFIEKI